MGPRTSVRNLRSSARPASLVPDTLTSTVSQVTESYSTATLPPRYTITLALPPAEVPLDEAQQLKEYIKGEEALSDAWRRDEQEEGRLEMGWSKRGIKRRKLDSKGREGNVARVAWKVGVKNGDVPLWYTAGLSFPCLCQLDRWAQSTTPRFIPPLARALHPLPPHDIPSESPIPTSALPQWSSTTIGDLEPGLDELRHFEPLWQAADGGWGRGWGCDEIMESQRGGAGPSGAQRDRGGELMPDWGMEQVVSVQSVKKPIGKGKGKAKSIPIGAMEFRMPLVPPRTTPAILFPSVPKADHGPEDESSRTGVPIATGRTAAAEGDDWRAESKRRKAVWRGMMRDDEGYGKMWDIIDRPHSYSPLPPFLAKPNDSRNPHPARPPDFVLPRALSSSSHPFHPSLSLYISSQPHARLHWVIPIHGPVFIPHINIPLPQPGGPSHPLTPSSATLSAQRPAIDPATRPFPVLWTPEILARFMRLLLALYRDKSQPMGALSIRLSGPKPDPFLDLTDPPPLARHQHVQEQLKERGDGLGPVRAECGDHIRVYVDAKYALALRTWLYALEIPCETSRKEEVGAQRKVSESSGGIGMEGTVQSGDVLLNDTGKLENGKGKGRGLRVFHKARLALIGEKGEVLIVA